jgi:hypothetical protein
MPRFIPQPTLAELEQKWRGVIRMRCEWHTLLFGSWRYSTPRQIANETPPMQHEVERFGPPAP